MSGSKALIKPILYYMFHVYSDMPTTYCGVFCWNELLTPTSFYKDHSYFRHVGGLLFCWRPLIFLTRFWIILLLLTAHIYDALLLNVLHLWFWLIHSYFWHIYTSVPCHSFLYLFAPSCRHMPRCHKSSMHSHRLPLPPCIWRQSGTNKLKNEWYDTLVYRVIQNYESVFTRPQHPWLLP